MKTGKELYLESLDVLENSDDYEFYMIHEAKAFVSGFERGIMEFAYWFNHNINAEEIQEKEILKFLQDDENKSNTNK